MPQAWVGLIVQTPATPLLNGGEDKMPAVITAVGSTGPNGGIMVSLKTFPNTAVTLIAYDASVELMDYEDDARELGVGGGAWPMDVS